MAFVADASERLSQRAAIPPMPVCRLSVDVYEEMIRAGIITKDTRVELLDGWLVPKMTQNPPHVVAAELARDALQQVVPDGWCVFSEKPVLVGMSIPEPDAVVVRGQRREYRNRRIRAEDVGLVVEVADASLERDQVFKRAIYAQAGIPVYWLVNLIDGRIEEYTGPTSSADSADYLSRRDYLPADEIPFTLDGNRLAGIPVRDLLP